MAECCGLLRKREGVVCGVCFRAVDECDIVVRVSVLTIPFALCSWRCWRDFVLTMERPDSQNSGPPRVT